jgi:quinol-cytochrome oxidoreductase complex cytochrome b subunit
MTSEASRKKPVLTDFFLHLHPRTVPKETLRFRLSFGLGGMAATLFATMVLTGVLQVLLYSSHPESAYLSIQQMYDGRGLGGFIRNIHFWAGNLLVIITFSHLIRVYLTGALGQGRRFNWLLGMTLFLLVLFSNFTGYLLPWDQLAYWAVTIFTSMTGYLPIAGDWMMKTLRGGQEIGSPTLANFFAIHVSILPTLLLVLLIFHFWLIRKAGGLVRHQGDQTQETVRVRTVPHLIQREAAVGLVLLGLLFTFSALVDAPLADQANPGQSPNPAKAAWYFMGLQELLLHLHPSFAICIVPGLIILCFALIPFWQGAVLPPGVWFGGKRGRNLALLSSLGGFIAAVLLVVGDEKLFRLSEHVLNTRTWLTRGMLPLAAAVTLLVLFFLFLRRQSYSRAEAVMALVLVTIGSISGLTAIGIWFRGPGMTLSWPF